MKFNFKLSNIEISGVNVGGVEVQTELSISELIAIRKEQEHVLENLPKYLDQLGLTAEKFMELDEHFDNKIAEQHREQMRRQLEENSRLRAVSECLDTIIENLKK